MRRILICLAWLAATGLASAPAKAQDPAAAELRKNLGILETSTEFEDEAWEKLIADTSRKLIAYLRTHDVSAAGAQSLGLELTADSQDAAHFRVFTYSYQSGGTRGTVHRPVFQWTNAAGQHFAYHPDLECYYNEIYKLATPGRTLYLLLGQERGDGRCLASEAYVLELKGNYLLLDHAAFGQSPGLVLCNVEMTFQAARQTLRISLAERPYPTDEEARTDFADALLRSGYRIRRGAQSVGLLLSGARFGQKP
ncbi:hypothetical protein [Hymenobacter chitinivorans]|uniref:Uncharacterized protein n=1 Tax=Hymenobacter chitinivorans DSM 11115 TaxID=1121954 RepID=A0A2M9B5N5_9BACT|nr:hypothetical protein [Hymenobacter chitinivorans]PJJ53258.1 hypothetical protein CLV45_3918 [Hymenobacter chitinivorans DSM 11115]